jgi:hypothetical protein
LIYERKETNWQLLLASVTVLAVGNADRIKLFKLGPKGIDAEFREVIEEARTTITEMHRLALASSELFLWLIQTHDRWGGGSERDKLRYRDRLIALLRDDLRVPDESLRQVLQIEHPFIRFDYSSYVSKAVTKEMSTDQRTAWNDFWKPRSDAGIGGEPAPGELRRFLEQVHLMNDEVAERLRDYEHWDSHHEHRRTDAWIARFDKH